IAICAIHQFIEIDLAWQDGWMKPLYREMREDDAGHELFKLISALGVTCSNQMVGDFQKFITGDFYISSLLRDGKEIDESTRNRLNYFEKDLQLGLDVSQSDFCLFFLSPFFK